MAGSSSAHPFSGKPHTGRWTLPDGIRIASQILDMDAGDRAGAAVSWEHFAHGADIGVRGRGPTREAAFEQAALALTAVVTDPGSVRPAIRVPIECRAPDGDVLFVDWLNALVYEMSTRRMLFSRFRVHTDGASLTAEAWGEPVDRGRHRPAVEPKGATFTGLAVQSSAAGWEAGCVIDV